MSLDTVPCSFLVNGNNMMEAEAYEAEATLATLVTRNVNS
jgi:hypothetical protein